MNDKTISVGDRVLVGGHGNYVGRTGTVTNLNSSGWLDIRLSDDSADVAVWPEHVTVEQPTPPDTNAEYLVSEGAVPSVDKARVEEAQELVAEARSAYAAFVAAWQEVGRLVESLDRNTWYRVDAYPGWNGTRDVGAGKDMAGWMDEIDEMLEDASHADDADYVSESEKRAMDGNR